MVIVYHGVRGPGDPEGGLPPKLEPEVFGEHLDYLAATYEVVGLRALLTEPPTGAAGRIRVAITFDDDLRGHATVAAPMLRERGLTATFFLTGSALHGEFNHWWLDLEAIAGAGDARWRSAREELTPRWPWMDAAPGDVATTIMRLPPTERAQVAAELRRLSGGAGGDPGLDAEAIAGLASLGFEIGFHTLRHEPLDTLAPDELAAAMTDGVSELTAAAGERPRAIAYPHGRTDLRVAHAAAAAGFEWGFGLGDDRAVRIDDQPLMLPRIDPYSGSLAVGAFAFRLARIAFAAARRPATAPEPGGATAYR
jgi:peptidoglycan/xylan/chitin deacetylase (PgdA/CDA1 family)